MAPLLPAIRRINRPRIDRRTLHRIGLLTGLACFVFACSKANPKTSIRLFAAASLSETLRAIESDFEAQHPKYDLVLNLAGSQQLATQILAGAKADLFLSANHLQSERVWKGSIGQAPQAWLRNEVLLVVNAQRKDIQSLSDIQEKKPRLVMAAKAVPLGEYSRQLMDQLSVRQDFEKLVISNEDSVRGVVMKMQLGEADLAFVYRSDLLHNQQKNLEPKLLSIALDQRVRAQYYFSDLSGTTTPSSKNNSSEKNEFVRYLGSPQAHALFRSHGFEVVEKAND